MRNTFQLNPITFPLWWYTVGFGIVWRWAKRFISYGAKKTGFSLFIRYMRYPLYGDYSRSGRIISFFLRLVLLFVKMIALSLRLFFIVVVLLVYVVILPLSLVMALYLIIPM